MEVDELGFLTEGRVCLLDGLLSRQLCVHFVECGPQEDTFRPLY